MNRTKKIISDAFWQLLEEKPYNKITVHNIVERCQVNRNTFYYYFRDIPDLAEYSIETWANEIIENNSESGSPFNCVSILIQECTKRKNAFFRIYRSAHQEIFLRYLNKISLDVVSIYVEITTKDSDISPEDRDVLIKFYKVMLTGGLLDWFDSGMSYDLLEFYQKISDLPQGIGRRP